MPRIALAPAPHVARPHRSAAAQLIAGLRAIRAVLRRAAQRRATLAALHRLNDRQLADIGLCRDSIEDTVRERYGD